MRSYHYADFASFIDIRGPGNDDLRRGYNEELDKLLPPANERELFNTVFPTEAAAQAARTPFQFPDIFADLQLPDFDQFPTIGGPNSGIVSGQLYSRPSTDIANANYNPDWDVYRQPNGYWDYPPDDGFDGARVSRDLNVNQVVDRFGGTNGSFLSPQNTPHEQRALPPDTADPDYLYVVYRVERPIPVFEGRIAGAFDQPGGGIQYLIDWDKLAVQNNVHPDFVRNDQQKIQFLLDRGYLSEEYRDPL